MVSSQKSSRLPPEHRKTETSTVPREPTRSHDGAEQIVSDFRGIRAHQEHTGQLVSLDSGFAQDNVFRFVSGSPRDARESGATKPLERHETGLHQPPLSHSNIEDILFWQHSVLGIQLGRLAFMSNQSLTPGNNPQSLWQVPAFLPYVQPKLTNQIVRKAEKQLKVKLPDAYLDILRFQNGGTIRYELPDSVLDKIYGIGPRSPSITTEYVSEEWGKVSFEIDGLVPIDGDGHCHICLDYREGRTNPCVTYVDMECDSQSPIAKTFAEFLSKLRLIKPDYQFVILGLKNITRLKKAIEAEVGHKFGRASSREHGYKTYIVSDSSQNQSIWMSPNLCRRGFVPRTSHYYQEVKHLFPEDATRLPGCPEEAIFASTESEWRPALERCVEKLSLEMIPMDEFQPAIS